MGSRFRGNRPQSLQERLLYRYRLGNVLNLEMKNRPAIETGSEGTLILTIGGGNEWPPSASYLGRGQGLGARRIQQADASRQDVDHPIAFKLGKGTADRFNGQAQEIRDIQATHRQRYRL